MRLKQPKNGVRNCELRGGGSSRLRFWGFLTSTQRHSSILCPNYPNKGLKWPWEWFLTISEIKIFLPFFVFGESPKPRKNFFRKIFFSKSSRGRNSQYFLTGLVLNERYFNFAHTNRADSEDFAPWGSGGTRIPKFWRLGHFFVIFGTSKGKIFKIGSISMCEIEISFI